MEREGDSLRGEEVALVLKAFGFDKNTQIAAGEIYGSEHRLSVLREAFPRIVSLSVLVSLTSGQSFLTVMLSHVVYIKDKCPTLDIGRDPNQYIR